MFQTNCQTNSQKCSCPGNVWAAQKTKKTRINQTRRSTTSKNPNVEFLWQIGQIQVSVHPLLGRPNAPPPWSSPSETPWSSSTSTRPRLRFRPPRRRGFPASSWRRRFAPIAAPHPSPSESLEVRSFNPKPFFILIVWRKERFFSSPISKGYIYIYIYIHASSWALRRLRNADLFEMFQRIL